MDISHFHVCHRAALLWQSCGKCLAQGLLLSRFPAINSCVSHAVSQPVFPTEFNQSECWEVWWSYELCWGQRAMMDELLTAQGCDDVCLNQPVNAEPPARVQRSCLGPWLNPYTAEKAKTGSCAGVIHRRKSVLFLFPFKAVDLLYLQQWVLCVAINQVVRIELIVGIQFALYDPVVCWLNTQHARQRFMLLPKPSSRL